MTDIDAVRAYRERLLDLVVNRSDVRMGGAVQYVPRGKETLEIFDAAIAALEAEVATLRSLIQMERQQAAAAEDELERQKQLTVWAQDEQAKWKALADERWEQCKHEAKMRDEAEADIERLKCCGNCIHGSFEDAAFICCRKNDDSVPRFWWGDTHTSDACHFTPSRWTERGAE